MNLHFPPSAVFALLLVLLAKQPSSPSNYDDYDHYDGVGNDVASQTNSLPLKWKLF